MNLLKIFKRKPKHSYPFNPNGTMMSRWSLVAHRGLHLSNTMYFAEDPWDNGIYSYNTGEYVKPAPGPYKPKKTRLTILLADESAWDAGSL